MATNQELRHQSFRDAAGTAGTYNEDLYSTCLTTVSDQGSLNGTLLAFLQDNLGSSGTNLTGLMNEFAVSKGATGWDDLGTFELTPGTGLIVKKELFSITVGDTNESSDEATLTESYDANYSVPMYFGRESTQAGQESNFSDISFTLAQTDGTTIQAQRGTTATTDVTVYGEIVQFNPVIVKKVHHMTVEILANATTQVSSAVDAVKANCVPLYMGSRCAFGGSKYHAKLEVTGSDGAVTVTAVRNSSTAVPTYVQVALIEFEAGMISSNQRVEINIQGSNVRTNTAAINAVDLSKAMIFRSGMSSNSSSNAYWTTEGRLYFSATNEVTASRGPNPTATPSMDLVGTVIELEDGIKSIQHITDFEFSFEDDPALTKDYDITAVNRDNTLTIWSGFENNNNTNPELDKELMPLSYVDNNTIRLTRNNTVGHGVAFPSLFILESYTYVPPPPFTLDAAEGVTLIGDWDPTDVANLDLTGTNVNSLSDASGNAYTMIADSGTEPQYSATLINGQPGIAYDGVDYLYNDTAVSDLSGLDTPFSFFWVVQIDGSLSTDYHLGFSNTSSSATYFYFANLSNGAISHRRRLNSGDQSTQSSNTGVIVANTPSICGITFDGSTIQFWENGVKVGTGTANISSLTLNRLFFGGLSLGGGKMTVGSASKIGRVVLYDGVVTDADAGNVFGLINDTYGIY